MYEISECNSCEQFFLVERIPSNQQIVKIYPETLSKPVDDRLPENIKQDLKSALACFAINEYRASVTMARRALQGICLEKGAPKDQKLKKQIDYLFTEGVITKDLKEWAHEVRYVGNDGAHPEDPADEKPVDRNDAQDILELLEKIADVLYVATAIAAERKKAREEPNGT